MTNSAKRPRSMSTSILPRATSSECWQTGYEHIDGAFITIIV